MTLNKQTKKKKKQVTDDYGLHRILKVETIFGSEKDAFSPFCTMFSKALSSVLSMLTK